MGSTVADTIAAALRRHGVRLIFGQSNPTALMLAAERIGIRQVLYRTENAGGAMADGYARISGQISVLAVQNGPAATLAVAPMAEAMKVSIPMLVLVQEVPAAARDRNAFQELDHFQLFSEVSKWTRRIDDPSRAEDYVDLAMTAANTGRPGPVVLLLPKDVLRMESQNGILPRTQNLGSFPIDRPRPAANAVERAAYLLATARSPLIMAGGGVHLSGATADLAALQELGHLPVATTNMGKGAVDETHPLSLGVAANVTGDHGPAYDSKRIIDDADVVLLVGTRTNENGTDGWRLTSPDATYIHIDVDGHEVGRNYEAVRLVGDAKAALQDLATELKRLDLSERKGARPALEVEIADGRRRRAEGNAVLTTSDASPIAPERLMTELDELLDPSDIIVADASYSSIWVTTYLTARRPGQRFLTPRGLAGMGWGVPLGMGAKLASPESRVVCLVGDGGFGHVWSEIETSVREKVPVVVIVLNNAQLGYQRHGENLYYGTTTTAIDFAPVDHTGIARAVGALGVLVEKPAQIGPALVAALNSQTTTVIDVLTDPSSFAPARIFDGKAKEINVS